VRGEDVQLAQLGIAAFERFEHAHRNLGRIRDLTERDAPTLARIGTAVGELPATSRGRLRLDFGEAFQGGDGVHIIWRAYFCASNSPSRSRTSARDRP
jgi:hypothetical protein